MKEYLKLKRSFTLIELLVVIAIIGLLSSVILVNLSGPRQKAKITKALEFSQSIQHAIGNEAVGIWDFDDCSAKDLSGYKNDGTINGAVCVDDTPYKVVGSGQGKNALSFDGNDYIDIPGNFLGGLTEVTFSAWVKIQSNPATGKEYRLIDRGIYSPYNPNTFLLYITAAGVPTIHINNADWAVGPAVPIGAWFHIAGTWKSGSFSYVYINGVSGIKGTFAQPSITAGSISTNIGRSPWWPDGYFNGTIDEVRIYTIALTQSQIQQHYLAGLKTHQQLTIK